MMFNMTGNIVRVLKDGRYIFVEKDEVYISGRGILVFGIGRKNNAGDDMENETPDNLPEV